MSARVERIAWGGWSECVRLRNAACELVVTAEVGPRILRLARAGGAEMMLQLPEQMGQTGGDDWRLYGGHRLWHAPEHPERTYVSDNRPVPFELGPDRVTFSAATEPGTGIAKQLAIQLDPTAARVTLTHRLENRSLWPIEFACWALTALGAEARAAIPRVPRRPHPQALLPAGGLAIWAYTDLSDPRWTWGRRFIQLRQDPARSSPQKIGASASAGWMAGWREDTLLLKRWRVEPGARYPDRGSAAELFTDGRMLELETLGPLRQVPPGGVIEHVERWSLHPMAAWPEDEATLAEALEGALG